MLRLLKRILIFIIKNVLLLFNYSKRIVDCKSIKSK